MSKRILPAVLAMALVAGLVSVGVAGAAATKTVALRNIAFSPKSLKVARGTKVTFAFRDASTIHNVTSIGKTRFASIANKSSGSVTRAFTRAGTYRYECTLHPGMTWSIVVR